MNKHTAGHLAETFAGIYFLLKGYRILARNYITGRGTTAGEIDLIVCRGKTVVFVEVKQRADLSRAVYAISSEQQKRIRRAAAGFVARRRYLTDYDIRFDAFLLSSPWRFRHIKNAF